MNQRAFPISFSFLGALIVSVLCVLFCLAWVVSRLPNLLYAYSDNVSITWLFSKGYFHAVLRTLLPGNAYPIQQINFPLAILFSITAWIPISSLFLLWLGQSLLGILLLFRSSRLVSSDYSLERFVFIALVLAHPRFWILLTISPDQILIALLFVESLLQCQSRIEIGVRGGIALLLLTMTGCDGFMWAAILAFSVSLVTIPHFGSTSEIFRKRWFYALGSIVPAGFLFLFLSLQYGQPGGVRLSDYPTLFSEISFTRLLHGDWTRNIGDFLLWMANGFISMPFPLPVWGGLALLGLTDGWMKSGSRQIFDRSCGMMCFFAVFLYAFLPAAEAHRASMPLLLLTAYFAMRGLSWFAETVSVSTWTATAVGGGLLAVLAAMHTPGEWSPIVQRARYHQSLFQILDREIDPLLLHANNSAAIRFNPTIFSRLSSPERIYPVGLSLQGFIDGRDRKSVV